MWTLHVKFLIKHFRRIDEDLCFMLDLIGIVQFKPTYVPKTLDTRLEGFLVGFLQNDSHPTFSTNDSHPSNHQRKNLCVLL